MENLSHENNEPIILLLAINNKINLQIENKLQLYQKHSSSSSSSSSSSNDSFFPSFNGIPLFDLWFKKIININNFNLNNFYLLTIQKYHTKCLEWGYSRNIPSQNILQIKQQQEQEQEELNEVSSLLDAIKHFQVLQNKNLLIISGNHLIDDEFDLSSLFHESIGNEKVVTYQHHNDSQKSNNLDLDIFVNSDNHLVSFPKKENTNNDSNGSNQGNNSVLIPIYTLSTTSLDLLFSSLVSTNHNSNNNNNNSSNILTTLRNHSDLLSFLFQEYSITYQSLSISHYYPLQSINDYYHTLNYLLSIYQQRYATLPNHVNITCPARAGLLGNPSDGFGGKTLSFVINNFYAEVTIVANSTLEVELIPHPIYDMTTFESFDSLQKETQLNVMRSFNSSLYL